MNIGRARYPLAVIPIWWLLSASAVAEPGAPANEDISERSDEQSPPPPSDEDSTPLLATEVDGKGMLIVLSDPQDHFSGKPPSGWIANDDNRVSFVLSDDGKAPDAKAGDSIYTRLVADAPRGPNVEITLTEGDGKEMWRDRVPIGSEIPQPRADLRVDGSRVKANFTTFPKVEGATGLPYLQGEENEAFPFPQGGVLTAPSAGGPLSPSGRDNATQFMMGALLGLIGLAVGGGLGLAFGRQRRGPSDSVDDEDLLGPILGGAPELHVL